MNQILANGDGSFCTSARLGSAPCVYQYYTYTFAGTMVVVATTQFLVVKLCRVRACLVAPRTSLVGLCLFFLVIIQWRYLIAASQYVPKTMFASGTLNTYDCESSMKGGKQENTGRDCRHGQLANCSKEVPCTVCNPTAGMDEKAAWSWWIQGRSPCQSCNTSSIDCGAYESGEAMCSKTFEGPLFDGTVRVPTLYMYHEKANPLEFWRTREIMVRDCVVSLSCFFVCVCVCVCVCVAFCCLCCAENTRAVF